ncbi:putative colanic acid polymerase WcaD [Paenarthrobacter sp. NEAU-H11]|uniref:putative colanic acid polymerase WcaD n=1 Tax=Paenarthrobacter sp. NEAU-H11 TaxID=3423924 RepID=UPI003D34127C
MQRLVSFLTFVSIIFQHFTLFNLASFEITVGLVAGLAVVFLLIEKIHVKLVAFCWISLAALTSAAAISSPITVPINYVQTFALFVLATFIVASSFGPIHVGIVKSEAFSRSLLLALAAVVAISIGQVVLGTLGSSLLFNPFGTHQYLHEYKPYIGIVQFPRAHGFFLEPSYNAFVIGSVAAALLCLKRFSKTTTVLTVLGLIACQSATGLLLLVFLLALVASRSRPAIAIAAAGLIFGVILYAGDYLWIRLLSFGTEGSSAYYRVFAPVEVLMDVLADAPLGMPLGSVEQVMSRYGLEMAGVQATSLDNGFYVIIFYFGWLGVLLLILMLAATLYASRIRSSSAFAWVAPIWLFASLFFSGGIMAPEFAVMTFIVVARYRSTPRSWHGKTEVNFATQHYHRNLSRFTRSAADYQLPGTPTGLQ